MKTYLISVIALLLIFNSNAVYSSEGQSNLNYKNLKVHLKVLEHYRNSDIYLAQIDFDNTGDSAVAFWETTSNYAWIFSFSAYGIIFINQNQRINIENNITDSKSQSAVRIKTNILPHTRYTIKTQLFIFNKDRFIKTNKKLRLEFYYNDANLEFMQDQMCPKIISQDTIDYKW